MTAAIEIRGLARSFGSKRALSPLDLRIEAGGITGLLGPNGSGKSTLMRMLVGLVRPDAGSAQIDGVQLKGDGLAVRKRTTYAPGEMGTYGELKGLDHLHWSLRGRGARARSRAREIAEQFELPLKRRVAGYSHGMKRQLLLAAAMAPEVPVRILDEPTEGLDPSKRSRVIELLRQDSALGTTILLSSHHLGEVAESCQRLVFINAGNLVADENAAELNQRARRLVHLEWPQESSTTELQAHLSSLSCGQLTQRERGFSVLLESPDPRPFLAQLAQCEAIPAPSKIEYGSPSLQDLYRDLYGVEGL